MARNWKFSPIIDKIIWGKKKKILKIHWKGKYLKPDEGLRQCC